MIISKPETDLTPGAALHVLGAAVDSRGKEFTPVFELPIISYRADDFMRTFGVRSPNHIKLDVDGTELEVLHGAEEILSWPSLQSMLIELEPTRDTATAIIEFLTRKGFVIHSKRSHGDSPTDQSNYIFVRFTHANP